MRILGGILVFVGLLFGLVAVLALISITEGDGGLACIGSLAAMLVGTLLLQEAQHPLVFSILMKIIRQLKQPQP
jgi:hypothetical protein